MDLEKFIRNVPDFPKKGIGFKDITTLIKNGEAFHTSVDEMANFFNPNEIDLVAGIEARGFVFASALAYKWKKGAVLFRKPGKLPYKTVSETYALEYGTDSLHVHVDAIQKGQKILLVDDLLATGGTMQAACNIVEKMGGIVAGVSFVIELDFLKGKEKFINYKFFSSVHYGSE
ncbi:adenine phosphoribosyltransferase [bacterium]|nr:adenine phosphoribosyltransferase [bacterium]